MTLAPPVTVPSRPAEPAPKPHTKWPIAIGLGVAASIILAMVVLAFMWPNKASEAHNLPVSIAGPAASVNAVETALGESGVFNFIEATDRADAVAQIDLRQTYGAIVLSAPGQMNEVLTAPAGSPAVAQILSGMATQLQAQMAQQVSAAGGDASSILVKVTPVIPLSENDPNGSGLASASFPLAIGGMLGGILISLLVVGPVRRLAAVAGFALAAGLVLASIMQLWFQYLQGHFWINALALGITMLATSSFIIGCTSLVGKVGIPLGAIVTMFIGNPLAGTTAPWQFLPAPWGAIGQFMVPGASGTLIRTLSYFPDASSTQQWLTLSAWVALGVILTMIGHFRSRPAMHVPESSIQTAYRPAHS